MTWCFDEDDTYESFVDESALTVHSTGSYVSATSIFEKVQLKEFTYDIPTTNCIGNDADSEKINSFISSFQAIHDLQWNLRQNREEDAPLAIPYSHRAVFMQAKDHFSIRSNVLRNKEYTPLHIMIRTSDPDLRINVGLTNVKTIEQILICHFFGISTYSTRPVDSYLPAKEFQRMKDKLKIQTFSTLFITDRRHRYLIGPKLSQFSVCIRLISESPSGILDLGSVLNALYYKSTASTSESPVRFSPLSLKKLILKRVDFLTNYLM